MNALYHFNPFIQQYGTCSSSAEKDKQSDWRGCHTQLAGTGAAKTKYSISAAQMSISDAPKKRPWGCHAPGRMGFYTLSWAQTSTLTTQGSCLHHPVRKPVPQLKDFPLPGLANGNQSQWMTLGSYVVLGHKGTVAWFETKWVQEGCTDGAR